MFLSRNSWLIGCGTALSLLGDQMLLTGLLFLAARDTGSVLFTSTFALMTTLAYTLLGPLGGMWLDRHNPRPLLVGADLLRAVLLLVLLVCWTSPVPWTLVLVTLGLLAALSGWFTPGFRSLGPALVPREHLLKHNSLNTTLTRIATLVGPLLGGWLVTVSGFQVLLWLDILTFVASAGCLLLLKTSPGRQVQVRTPSKPVWSLLSDPLLRRCLILASGINAGISVFLLMLPAAALHWKLSGVLFGVLQAAYQGGMLLVGVWMGLRPWTPRQGLSGGLVLMGLSVLLFSVSGPISDTLVLPLLACLAFGGSLMFSSLLADTLLQQRLPRDQLAGGFGVVQGIGSALRPLSILLGGLLLDRWGLGATGLLLALLFGVSAVLALQQRPAAQASGGAGP